MCTHWHRNGTFKECHLLHDTVESGMRVTLPHSHCISCKCQVRHSSNLLKNKNYLITVIEIKQSRLLTILANVEGNHVNY